MIARDEYLEQLKSFREKNIIKVITGIRRCGKSTLFEIYQEYLIKDGVDEKQIISINLEDGDYIDIENYKDLYHLVNDKLIPDKVNYIFLDEVQKVKEFQKAVDSLYIKKNCDVYITGSNAYLLSGELATLLSGRYIEVKMLPLSFKEYIATFPDNSNIERLYQEYIRNSSFPYTLELKKQRDIKQFLDGLFNSIVIKDIITRNSIQDIEMLKSVVRFLFDNIGNLCTTKKISDTMTSSGRKISVHTVEKYINALTNAFIFYKTSRFDIKGKQYLKTMNKYYAADIGLRYNILGTKRADHGHILENIVYLELIRRGYEVFIGKVGQKEVDFIAVGELGEEYYQVAYTVIDTDGKTLERELSSLSEINDHNPKYLLTMDKQPITSHNGIKQIYVLDWIIK